MSNRCTVRYSTVPARFAKGVALLVLPVYFLSIVPIVLLLITMILVASLGSGIGIYFLAGSPAPLLVVLLLTVIPAFVFAAMSIDDRIILDADGITLPLRLSFLNRLRQKRFWQEVSSVTALINDGDRRGWLLFRFAGEESIRLALDAFSPKDLSSMLVALEVCLPEKTFEGKEALRGLLCKDGPSLLDDCYRLWDRELESRFHPAVFVPLEAGAALRGGDLTVVRQLAYGGMAAVYLARKSGRELVVLKEAVLPLDSDDDTRAKMIELFEREARLLTRTSHRRLARVYDYFVENGRHYLVLEYIAGLNLRQLVRERGLPDFDLVRKVILNLCQALNYIHRLDPPMIHRDVTPENIVIDDCGETFLIDFGGANDWLGTATGTVVGKHNYMSVEQFRGKASPRSDFYSLGCTVYFLLTGSDPVVFTRLSPRVLRESVPEDLDRLVYSLTEQDESRRPADVPAIIELMGRSEG